MRGRWGGGAMGRWDRAMGGCRARLFGSLGTWDWKFWGNETSETLDVGHFVVSNYWCLFLTGAVEYAGQGGAGWQRS